QPVVGHDRPDHRPAQATGGAPVVGQHVHQVVAVADPAGGVDEQDPVAVAVEGDAQVGAGPDHALGELLRVGGAHPGIDVQPIGVDPDRVDLGADRKSVV